MERIRVYLLSGSTPLMKKLRREIEANEDMSLVTDTAEPSNEGAPVDVFLCDEGHLPKRDNALRVLFAQPSATIASIADDGRPARSYALKLRENTFDNPSVDSVMDEIRQLTHASSTKLNEGFSKTG